jgi:transcriptional regulator with XRE-family HTH domain
MGQRLKELRLRAGLTQEALARAADVGSDAVRKWETGRRTPMLDMASRLADVLGCTLDELAGRTPLADQGGAKRRGKGKGGKS